MADHDHPWDDFSHWEEEGDVWKVYEWSQEAEFQGTEIEINDDEFDVTPKLVMLRPEKKLALKPKRQAPKPSGKSKAPTPRGSIDVTQIARFTTFDCQTN